MSSIDIQPTFSENILDRMDHLRTGILEKRNPNTDIYLLLSKSNVLLNDKRECFIVGTELPSGIISEALTVFLGDYLDVHYFAVSVSPEEATDYDPVPFREFVMEETLSEPFYGILAEANSLLSWHHSHGFCACCGEQSLLCHGGWRRDCPNCETQHFPRTDPVVIMLVTQDDQCLLGRGYNFPENHYSCLAGFMEPGETIEQAALRELWEESGIEGENVRYLLNQPWPFPSNLMVGVHIDAKNTELNIDLNELEGAMWVSKTDVLSVLNGDLNKPFLLPPKIAIARNLLEYWVK